jgi:hypothetical protein
MIIIILYIANYIKNAINCINKLGQDNGKDVCEV